MEKEKDIEVHSSDVSVYVLDTGLYRIDVRPNAETEVFVFSGLVEAAGESGLRALQVKGKIPELPLKGALKAIEGFLQTRSQGFGGFEVAVRGNTITVKENTKTLN